MTTKAELETIIEALRKRVRIYESGLKEIRSESHNAARTRHYINPSWLIQRTTEIIEKATQ